MESALIVAVVEKTITFLTDILKQASITKIVTVSSAGEARRLLLQHDFDLCVINAPLPDESGENLARNISAKGISEVILIVRAGIYDEVCSKVEDDGVITVSKPMNRTLFWNAIKITQAAHKKMMLVQRENKKLLQKIEDIRTIDRAKCVLMTYRKMTEQEAHKYIERHAMDTRQSKRCIAEEILITYEE